MIEPKPGPTFATAVIAPVKLVIVLVYRSYHESGWAYMTDGVLPAHFSDTEVPIRKVPQKYHDEVAKAQPVTA